MALKVLSLSWDGFGIPFVASFETAHGVLRVREGLLLRLTTDEGIIGLGEVSPLAAFGGGSIDSLLRALEACTDIVGMGLDEVAEGSPLPCTGEAGAGAPDRAAVGERAGQERVPLPRALRSGLDIAVSDALARQCRVSVAEMLGGSRRSVPVNATISAGDPAGILEAVDAAVAQGFTHFKLKVGTAPTIAEEIERIATLRAAIGGSARLRIDANGAWDVDRAIEVIRATEPYDLEMVEQPVPAMDIAGMAAVRRAVGTPIAADEAVTGLEVAGAILEVGAADILVVKPMAVGGLRAARRIVQLAEDVGKCAIVTTTIDAGVGTAAALHLAATLRQPLACGLATGPLLAADLVVPEVGAGKPALPVHAGKMGVPAGPGLGVRIDEDELERFGTGVHGEMGTGAHQG